MNKIITVKKLKKNFKKFKRETGLWNAIKSLFYREYETIKAVKEFNLEVNKGEIIGLIGPNGAGKSTIIKMLTGILHPDEGEIKCLNYTPWLEREKYVKNIGVVFGQKTTLWWDLPAVDSFELNKDIYEVSEKEFRKRLNELTELLEVKDISKTQVRKLSLGERMKCEFINSVLHKPKILFLDEPTIGLDVVAKEKIREFIKKINKEEETTIILTTHDISDIEQLCNRIIIIDKGLKIYEGTINELKKKYINYKRLIIELEKEIKKKIKIPNCKLIKQEEIKAVLQVNIKKTSISQVIDNLFKKYKIKDINIEEQSVESIIRKIYEDNNEILKQY